MYHICPAECQIQLIPGKGADNRDPGGIATRRGGKLGDPVGAGFRLVDQPDGATLTESALDLDEAGNHLAGLAGQRQGTHRRLDQQAIDAGGKTRLDLDWNAEGAREELLLLRRADMGSGRRHPDAAAGQAPAQIGDDRAVRSDDEADQPVDRERLPGDDAGAKLDSALRGKSLSLSFRNSRCRLGGFGLRRRQEVSPP